MTLLVASKCFVVVVCLFLCQNEMPHMSGTPFPTLLSFFFFLPLSQSLYGWTEYADVITKFFGIDRFEKEINCINRGRRSCMLSGLLMKAGMASRNIVMKKQYTLL